MTALPESSGHAALNPYTTPLTGGGPSVPRLVAAVAAPSAVVLPVPPPTPAAVPPGGVPALAPHRRLPRVPASARVALHWTGAHGGAGVTTLADLVPDTATLGRAWPVPPRGAAPTVLVSRTGYMALRYLQDAVTDWAGGHLPAVHLVGVAVVADVPERRLPRDLRDLLELVTAGVTQFGVRLWELPWVEAWRRGARPDLDTAPKEYRRLAADLTALVPALRGGQYPLAAHGSLS